MPAGNRCKPRSALTSIAVPHNSICSLIVSAPPAALHLRLHRQAQGCAAHHRRLHGEWAGSECCSRPSARLAGLQMPRGHGSPASLPLLPVRLASSLPPFLAHASSLAQPLPPSLGRSTPPLPSSTCLPSSRATPTGALPTAAGSPVSARMCCCAVCGGHSTVHATIAHLRTQLHRMPRHLGALPPLLFYR